MVDFFIKAPSKLSKVTWGAKKTDAS